MRTHLLIPDTQIRPDVPTEFLGWIGEYIVHKKPDVVVQIGDFADMHSLSSYDMGKKSAEGARYEEDVQASRDAMSVLMAPLEEYNRQQRKNGKKQYRPELHLTIGNHEERIERHVNANPLLAGKLSIDDLGYKDFGWTVHNFLDTVLIDGVLYSHFFPRGPNGRVMQNRNGAPSAKAMVSRESNSCTAGHTQGLDFHIQQTGAGRLYGLIAGSCYMHEEGYLTPQGTHYWRGIVMKHEVQEGAYDPMFVSLDYLRRTYG